MSGKSNIMMKVMADAHAAGRTIITYDMESCGSFHDLKTFQPGNHSKFMRAYSRDDDNRRWWKRFLG